MHLDLRSATFRTRLRRRRAQQALVQQALVLDALPSNPLPWPQPGCRAPHPPHDNPSRLPRTRRLSSSQWHHTAVAISTPCLPRPPTHHVRRRSHGKAAGRNVLASTQLGNSPSLAPLQRRHCSTQCFERSLSVHSREVIAGLSCEKNQQACPRTASTLSHVLVFFSKSLQICGRDRS